MERFVPLDGSITKFERKFVCTKRHLLDDYLQENASYLHSYKICQKYADGIKYRKYETENGVFCKMHSKLQIDSEHKEVIIKDISEKEFDSISTEYCVSKVRTAYRLAGDLILDVDDYRNDIVMIEVWCGNKSTLDSFSCIKGLYEVTGNKFYSNKYIAMNKDNILTRGLCIVEGTDLVGKTTVVEKMINAGYVCMDRDQYNFSDCIDLKYSYQESADRIANNYRGRDCNIVVMYAGDASVLKERLEKRLATCGGISEYDDLCCEYNEFYIQVSKILSKQLKNLTMIYVCSKTVDEILQRLLNQEHYCLAERSVFASEC